MPADLRRAVAVHPIASVQSEYSLLERRVETEVLPTCDELGVGFLAYAPLMRGLLGGDLVPGRPLDDADRRANDDRYPRVGPSNLSANVELTATVRTIADAHDATMAQVALAWLLARSPFVVPIPGAAQPRYVEENVRAVDIKLTADDFSLLEPLAARLSGPATGPSRRLPDWVSPPIASTS
jgi:aryl-alcohol dehydrogenase-like predicted oxidoreductase